MEKRPTIKEVAERAGVAKSTVSRYLNGKPVQKDSVRRIREAIEHYHYEANVFARLNAKQSNIIGIILPGFDSTVTPRVMTAIDKYLRTKDYTPLIINTEGDLNLEVRSIGNLARMRVDGIILVATYITPAHQKAVESVQTPVVFMGQEFTAGISVLDDNLAAGEELGRYVAGRGLRSVGFLWVTEDDIAVGLRRKEGILRGLAAGGVTDVRNYLADFTYQTAYTVARRILQQSDRPQILLCATDRIAYGVYKAARELGLRIPQDISVTGFGGYDTSELLTPPLTSIRFDSETEACVCADTVLKMFREEPVSKTQLIGYRFIEGGSVL
ncbi:MAG: LacI family DNA-binding transcriptional regulator [Blautia massiliensis (ex Durand et al. 2017)]